MEIPPRYINELLEPLKHVLEDISLSRLALASGLVLSGLATRKLLVFVLARCKRPGRLEPVVDLLQEVEKPLGATVVLFGLYLAVRVFEPSEEFLARVDLLFAILLAGFTTWFALQLVDIFSGALYRRVEEIEPLREDLIPFIRWTAKAFVLILAIFIVLQSILGYSISGLVAGLGIGGLALALAAQKILADILGSIILLVDRPFVLGDWVKSPDGNIEGVVERIGLRSTRVRTFEKTLIAVPNNRMADFVVDNIQQRPSRRVWITIGVNYNTTVAQMRQAVRRIETFLRGHPEVEEDDFLLVRFTDFGDHALQIMIYYFTTAKVWQEYMQVREHINLEILEILEQLNIAIALPARAVHLVHEQEETWKALRAK